MRSNYKSEVITHGVYYVVVKKKIFNKTAKMKVVTMEELLKQNKEEQPINVEEKSDEKTKPKAKPAVSVPKGKPKSGRVWKSEKTRFNSIIKTKGIRNSFEKKQALRKELARVKEVSRARVAAKQQEKEEKKERRRENLKRQEENRKKSEIVQVIRNTSKIKKMKKKHLRFIEKRDTTNM